MKTSIPLDQSDEGRAFLQHRVAVAGRLGTLLGSAFLILRGLEIVARRDWEELIHPSFLLHVAGTLSMALIWLVCRSGQRSVSVVRTTETVGLLAGCVFYSFMAVYIPEWQMPHYLVLLALQSSLVARAIYVPSTARRTLLLTIVAGVPMLMATYWIYADIDITKWRHIEDIPPGASAVEMAFGITLFAVVWWGATIAISAGASKVIYGLRKQVRDVRKLGQYDLVEKLGEGGMGVVYRAEHAMLRRPTAVKLLPPEKAGEATLTRFEKEVRLTARLTHPNTVRVFDYGRTPERVFYYAMELLDGLTLREIVEADGPQPPSRVARVLEHVAGALAEAHGVGLVHRDIKPANIMLVTQGGELDVAKVLDFGLVKELDNRVDPALTQAGTITGTPHYLAPERIIQPDTADARSDLYSLGAVGYYLLTGSHVFPGGNMMEVLGLHLHAEPTPPAVRLGLALPADLERLVLRCLAKDPAMRPTSATELALALRACRDVGHWTQHDAREWWARFGGLPGTTTEAPAEIGETLEIDLAQREPS